MSYLGTKPANSPLTSELIPDSIITNAKINDVAATKLTGTIPDANAPSGSVIQVVSATKTNTFSTSTTGSYVDITDLAVSITPSSSSSKILIVFHVSVGPSDILSIQLVRNSTPICIGDAGNGFQATLGGVPSPSNGDKTFPMAGNFLDSPNTTAATTYKIQMRNYTGTSFVNRTVNDVNAPYNARPTSTITVMEIAG